MKRGRTGRRVLAIAVLALLCTPIALAAPSDVIADWEADGRIDGHYAIGDLRDAPIVQKQLNPASVPGLLAAVKAKIDRDILGISPSSPASADADPPRADVPTWAVAGAIAAAGLLAAGIGSNIILRTRRRT